MGCMYSHAFICHLLLIYRILYFNLVLLIKAVILNFIILKILHPSPLPCFSIIIWYIVKIQLRLFETNGTNPVVLLYTNLSHLSAGFFSTSMSPVHCGLFYKGEKWTFYFNNSFLISDVIISPSRFWLNILSLDSAEETSGSSK